MGLSVKVLNNVSVDDGNVKKACSTNEMNKRCTHLFIYIKVGVNAVMPIRPCFNANVSNSKKNFLGPVRRRTQLKNLSGDTQSSVRHTPLARQMGVYTWMTGQLKIYIFFARVQTRDVD